MGETGAYESGPTTKESTGGRTTRLQEKVQTTIKMGRYSKRDARKNWRERQRGMNCGEKGRGG